VTIAWILFRAPNLDAALVVFKALGEVSGLADQHRWRLIGAAAACAILLPPSHRLAAWLTREPQPIVSIGLGLAAIAILVELGRDKSYEFI
jgi:hypothetical protein